MPIKQSEMGGAPPDALNPHSDRQALPVFPAASTPNF